MQKRYTLSLAALILMMTALACNLSVNLPSNPKPPVPSLVPSGADADAFEKLFQQAVADASQTGKFSVTVNQQQLSSWLSLRAPAMATQQGYTWPFKDAQAGLDNGTITLYGTIMETNVPQTPAQLVFTPSIDANGQLAVKIDSGQVGIVGIPAALMNSLTDTVKQTLTSQLAQIQGHYKLTSLAITGGNMSVSGEITK